MKQEDINEMRDKSCPDWLLDNPIHEINNLKFRLEKLEIQNAEMREVLEWFENIYTSNCDICKGKVNYILEKYDKEK